MAKTKPVLTSALPGWSVGGGGGDFSGFEIFDSGIFFG